jgi:hypothetical protein
MNTFKYTQILSNTLIYIEIYYKYIEIHHKCTTSTLKYIKIYYKYIHILSNTLKDIEYAINTQYRHLNKFKYTQILSNTLKYNKMYYKCIELH